MATTSECQYCRELVKELQKKLQHMLDRPDMYSFSPEAFEQQFWLEDEIVHSIVTRRLPIFSGNSPYREFCDRKELGSADFTSRMRIDRTNPPIENQALFQLLVSFFREYIHSDLGKHWLVA